MDVERNQSVASKKAGRRASQVAQDDDALVNLTGHEGELVRQFNSWSMFALAFSVLGTYATLAQNMSTGISNGGPVTILYGLVLVTVCNLCVALSLGELTSAMPTALGQAYWVFKTMTTPTGRFLSYLTAWINTFGWWTLTASQSAFMTNFILSLKLLYNPDWEPANHGWVKFLLYLGITLFLTLINATSCRRDKVLPWINNLVGLSFIGLFFVFILALLIGVGVRDGAKFQSGGFVFGTWINQTGWPSGVTWFTGLVQSAYGLTAFDSVVHMVEELPQASKTAPRLIWLAVLGGAITGWLFMAVCLATIQDLDAILKADLPFFQLCQDAMGLTPAVVLLSLFVVSGVGQNIGLTTTGSRLTWSFARDGGLPGFRYLAVVNDTWRVPLRAIWLQGVIIGLVGVLYLFANTVLQAVLAVSTIALTISYAIPIITLLVVGRDSLPVNIPFHLGRSGMLINVVSVIYCVVTTVFFFFPSEPNPPPADMNWAIGVFGVMLIVSFGFWFAQGHRTYLRTDTAMFRIMTAKQPDGELAIPEYREPDRVSQVLVLRDDSKAPRGVS